MKWRWCALVVVWTVAESATAQEPKSAPPAIVPAKGPVKPLSAEILIAKLSERVDVERAWSGTLENAVDHLATQTGIPIVIDHVSFKCADPPLEYANDALVRIDKAQQQQYRLLIERMLKPIGGVLLIREDRFEVVARQVASRDADPNYGPEESDSSGIIPPLASRVYPTISIVHVVSEKRTLDEVLRDLASTAEQNIVLAPQAGEKGKMTVTARMLNVRFEIALKLLADMADLQVVKRGNVWLFTSNVHAATMEAQAEKAQQTGQNAAAESTRGNQPLNTKGVLARQEDVHGLLLDLLALQIVEQQRRLTILQPDQQVKDHDRLEKLEEAVRELVEREKMRRIENRQKPGASPFNPDPQPVEKKP